MTRILQGLVRIVDNFGACGSNLGKNGKNFARFGNNCRN